VENLLIWLDKERSRALFVNTSLVSHAQQLGFRRAVYHKGLGAGLPGFEPHSCAPCCVTSGCGNVPPMGMMTVHTSVPATYLPSKH